MFTLYTVLLTLHILAVIGWLGAAVCVQVLTAQARDQAAWPSMLLRFAQGWFPPITGVTALLGVLLWIDGPWAFGELWLLLAVAGWLASAVIGARVLTPLVERWAAGDAAAGDRFKRLVKADTVLLVLIVADMVIKPGS